uniref:Uncharacterized protein n=1 Tax=Solanum lycopersicum TaxID=4081 RepID=K4CDE9_SOLLC
MLIFFNYPNVTGSFEAVDSSFMKRPFPSINIKSFLGPHGDSEGIKFVSLEVWFQCLSFCTLLLCHLVLALQFGFHQALKEVQFSSLFMEIPYLVVKSVVIQKFSTTTILSTSAFSAFSPDAYVCVIQLMTSLMGVPCGHLFCTVPSFCVWSCGLEEKFYFLWGCFCLLIYVEVSFGSCPLVPNFQYNSLLVVSLTENFAY